MTDTANLGLPFIEGSQAQKHVTHNEALRILDAVIQVAVLDANRATPPVTPDDGDRHIVAAAPSGAWAGHAFAIAAWEDGAWRFLAPQTGWIAWSTADDMLLVFDGSTWRDLRDLPAMVDMFGVHTTADATNRLSVRSNAVLFTNIAAADGGSGDMRLQLSKEGTGNTASVVFSKAFSARAEFGLVGSDAFKLKVSPDGSSFTDAFAIDQASGNLAVSRGLSLTGVISPAQVTSDQNNYAPAGFSSASIVRLSTDATRDITGLAAGPDGRIVFIYNAGAFNAVLKAENAASAAANRFSFASDVTLGARQGASLIYDATAARWRQVGGSAAGAGTVTGISLGAGLAGTSNPIVASGDIFIRAQMLRNRIINPSGALWQTQNTGTGALGDGTYAWDQWYTLTQAGGVTGTAVTHAENATPCMMRLSQAQASAQRMGLCQPLASADVIDLRGQPVVLSARVRMSAAATLRYAVIEWTGTADSITRDVVNDWTSAAFTPGNFFVSATTIVCTGSVALTANTLSDITVTGTISSSMNNLLVMVWTDAPQAQNVTLDLGKVQLTYGALALPHMPRSLKQELDEAFRFYEKTYDLAVAPGTATTAGQYRTRASGTSTILATPTSFMVPKFKTPAMTVYNPSTGSAASVRDSSNGVNVAVASVDGVNCRGFASLTTGSSFADANLNDFHWVADARL